MRQRPKRIVPPAEILEEGQPTWVRATQVLSLQNPISVVARNQTFTTHAMVAQFGPPSVTPNSGMRIVHILVQDTTKPEWIKIWWEEQA